MLEWRSRLFYLQERWCSRFLGCKRHCFYWLSSEGSHHQWRVLLQQDRTVTKGYWKQTPWKTEKRALLYTQDTNRTLGSMPLTFTASKPLSGRWRVRHGNFTTDGPLEIHWRSDGSCHQRTDYIAIGGSPAARQRPACGVVSSGQCSSTQDYGFNTFGVLSSFSSLLSQRFGSFVLRPSSGALNLGNLQGFPNWTLYWIYKSRSRLFSFR